MQPKNSFRLKQKFVISGDLDNASFAPWVDRHAKKLGLSSRWLGADAKQAVILVEGLPDLIDAMEMGCLLGPIDIWVDEIERFSI